MQLGGGVKILENCWGGGGVRKFHFGGRSCIVSSGSQNFERKFKIA